MRRPKPRRRSCRSSPPERRSFWRHAQYDPALPDQGRLACYRDGYPQKSRAFQILSHTLAWGLKDEFSVTAGLIGFRAIAVEQQILEDNLRHALSSERFLNAASAASLREGQLTEPGGQAVMAEIVDLLSPADVLEIGTYHADTTRYLAQFMAAKGAGHITTIDPLGAERVPKIIAAWPEAMRQRVTFHPQNSMSYFMDLELARAGTGMAAPFNLVYVDGHHAFEYALFDTVRAALYLRPGGVLVVDNMEQAGPSAAVTLFLSGRRHWRFFSLDRRAPGTQKANSIPSASAAIILAPNGIEIGSIPYYFDLFGLPARVCRLRLRLRQAGSKGSLGMTVNLYATPATLSFATLERRIDPSETGEIVIPLQPALEISDPPPGQGISARVELRYVSEHGSGPNVLLDADRPVILEDD
jgi:predicted O-methyltransferase YrrM